MTKLTDISIKNLKAGETRREIPDRGCRGLYLVLQPSGARSWGVRFRHQGKPKKLTLSGALSLAAARKCASDALLDLEQGRDPAEGKKTAKQKAATAQAETVEWLCANYLRREGGKLRSTKHRQRVLERLVFPAIGDVPLSELKRSHIVKLLDTIEDANGPMMADLTLSYVRKILNWHEARTDDFNSPIARGMSRATGNEGSRVLTDDELRRLWAATEPNEKAPQPFHALFRFLLLTGARRREVTELPWTEINGTDWTLPALRNKVKADLTRPLSKAAQAVLAGVPVIAGGELVFGDGHRPLSLTTPFAKLMAETGVTGTRLHDLRRTARTLLSRAGVNSDVAERCLGHTIGGVRGIYDRHTYHAEMLAAYEKLAALIENIGDPSERVVPMRRNG